MNGYNFTDRVRKVLQMARDAAVGLHHEYVGTEHILLAIVREGEGVAAAALTNLNVDLEELENWVESTVKQGKTPVTGPDLPYTSRAKKILEFSMSAARELNHSYVGTEHLLLGVLREEKGIGAQALLEAGLSYELVRAEVLRILGAVPPEGEGSATYAYNLAPAVPGRPGLQDALRDHWFKTAIALIELHQRRSGQYPAALEDLRPHMSAFDQPLLRSLRYERLPDGYALDIITAKDDKPTVSYPPEFWRGLGIRRTNVPGFGEP